VDNIDNQRIIDRFDGVVEVFGISSASRYFATTRFAPEDYLKI